MMRSLYSGVAGLKTHQIKMDVIGNNIANVNTTSYKSQSISFSDMLYQTTQSASGANAASGMGGTNARQLGLGSKSGAINTAITSQGSAQTTNNPFDIMITGSSFFVVSNGSTNFFTRDGSFCVDGAGNLVMAATGYTVMGWQADDDGKIIANTVSPLKVMAPDKQTFPPEATSKGIVSGILDKNDTNVHSKNGKIISMALYDNLGYKYNAKFSMHAIDADAGKYYIQLDGLADSNGDPYDATMTFGETINAPGSDTFTKSQTADNYVVGEIGGKYGVYDKTAYKTYKENGGTAPDQVAAFKDKADTEVTDSTAIQNMLEAFGQKDNYPTDSGEYVLKSAKFDSKTGSLTVSYEKKVENAMFIQYDPDNGKFAGIGANADSLTATQNTATLSFAEENFSTISIDFSASTMFNNGGTSTISATNGDADGVGSGRKLGEMSGISIAKDGIISATYDNGQMRVLGQIAVANFANAAGLEKAGDNLYSQTMNSGEFDGIGVDITTGGGYMTTGVLEMSNVDLSAEFTEMITTQRGFQANSRIITTSDTLLEELVNLKR